MAQIILLDDDTINKIAAGEVIERPASVVKELMENSIDAGATAVTVEIKDGGISFIRITDNGSGIEADQVRTAFLRHSTSKIRSSEDLLTVSSLGFRGEALASIAAVAKVELITKTADRMTGVRYCIEGGKEIAYDEIGAPAGTTFIVRDLFWNTPARREFLRSAQTEGSYIIDLVEKLALSHPDISFHLISGGQTKLHTVGSGAPRDDVRAVFGREVVKDLLQVEADSGTVKISGFIGRPALSRGNRSYEIYFINGRYIRSDLITRALEDAYHGFVMQHRYPFTVLYINIPSEYLDVNVHPAKMELRFRNEEELYNTVYDTVRQALSRKDLMPRVEAEQIGGELSQTNVPAADNSPQEPETPQEAAGAALSDPDDAAGIGASEESEKPYEVYSVSERPPEPFEALRLREELAAYEVTEAEQMELFDDRLLSSGQRDRFELIGVVFDTYFLVQYRDEFLMIDKHAAHEKVNYERMMKALRDREITCQQLDPPIILTLNARESQVLSSNMDQFTQLGYEIEPFGGKEYAVYGVPDNLPSIAREDLLLEMLDDLVNESGRAGSRILSEKIASMSCKAAVKGNQRLSMAEAEALIDELLSLDDPYTCPHGRPTAISMSRYEIEKKFKRIV